MTQHRPYGCGCKQTDKSEFDGLWNEIAVGDEIHPSAVGAVFIPEGDFIIEDDFVHPPGWISPQKGEKGPHRGCGVALA